MRSDSRYFSIPATEAGTGDLYWTTLKLLAEDWPTPPAFLRFLQAFDAAGEKGIGVQDVKGLRGREWGIAG
jgi:hypothetical protein